MKLNLIVAMNNYRVIGNKNTIPWHFPEDLKRFKKITSGHCVIMGRKTYESIGKPLPKRTNIIISKNSFKYKNEKNLFWVSSPDEAVSLAQKLNENEAFIIGGAKIYEQMLQKCDRMYLTIIYKDFIGDTFFPEYSLYNWETVSIETKKNKDFKYEYKLFQKI